MYYGSYEFPNLMLNLHPDCVMYYIGYPKGPNHTTVVSEFLFRPETIADPTVQARARRRVLGPHLASRTGTSASGRRPASVRARFTTGIYPRQDRFLYWFNEEYRVKMGREKLGRGPID